MRDAAILLVLFSIVLALTNIGNILTEMLKELKKP